MPFTPLLPIRPLVAPGTGVETLLSFGTGPEGESGVCSLSNISTMALTETLALGAAPPGRPH